MLMQHCNCTAKIVKYNLLDRDRFFGFCDSFIFLGVHKINNTKHITHLFHCKDKNFFVKKKN